MAQGIPDLTRYTTTGHPQEEPFLYKRLTLSGMTYQVETFAGIAATGEPSGPPTKTATPDGCWDFVIR